MENQKENMSNAQDGKQVKPEDIKDLPGELSETSARTAGTDSTDEDAADQDFAEHGTSKGYDRDQEELDLGLKDGDLDMNADAEDELI